MSTNTTKASQEEISPRKITPELVRRVAERVYGMLREELLIEQERARTGSPVREGGFRA